MQAVDANGQSAYSCGEDGSGLEAVPDADGVLFCPRCGLRTDASGGGALRDGFDVVHRQWGLRGDPHVWAALRSAIGEVPTPEDADGVRAAYAAGLRQVADIDVDGDRQPVRREKFAHGGMSSGMVDVGWWHDKGLPLLTERAMARRPAQVRRPAEARGPRSSGVRGLLTTLLIWLLVLAMPAALVGGGAWLLYQRAVGTQVEATVLACETSVQWARYAPRVSQPCVAEWTVDGQKVVGGFDGGNGPSDVGKTVNATVRGDTAYSRSLVLPIVLIVLGLPFLALLGAARLRRS